MNGDMADMLGLDGTCTRACVCVRVCVWLMMPVGSLCGIVWWGVYVRSFTRILHIRLYACLITWFIFVCIYVFSLLYMQVCCVNQSFRMNRISNLSPPPSSTPPPGQKKLEKPIKSKTEKPKKPKVPRELQGLLGAEGWEEAITLVPTTKPVCVLSVCLVHVLSVCA